MAFWKERRFFQHCIIHLSDRSAIVWDVESGKQLMTLGNHRNNVLFVHLFPDEYMALSSAVNIVKVRNIKYLRISIFSLYFRLQVWDLRLPETERCVHHLYSMGLVDNGENQPCERMASDQIPRPESVISTAAVEPMEQRYLFTQCNQNIRVWDMKKMEHLGMIQDLSWK